MDALRTLTPTLALPHRGGGNSLEPWQQNLCRTLLGEGGDGGSERKPYAASLCTPTLALPRLRGRGTCVPISCGLI